MKVQSQRRLATGFIILLLLSNVRQPFVGGILNRTPSSSTFDKHRTPNFVSFTSAQDTTTFSTYKTTIRKPFGWDVSSDLRNSRTFYFDNSAGDEDKNSDYLSNQKTVFGNIPISINNTTKSENSKLMSTSTNSPAVINTNKYQVDHILNNLATNLSDRTDNLATGINDRTDYLARDISDKRDNLETNISDTTDNLATDIKDRTDNLEMDISDRTDNIATDMSDKSNNIAKNISDRKDNLATNTSEQTDNQTPSIIDSNIITDYCRRYGTCDFVSKMPERYRFCHCDELCTIFKDCCWDANVTSVQQMDKPNIECIPYTYWSHSNFGNYLIRSCPLNFTDVTVTEKCHSTNILKIGPWVIGQHGFLYQNRYCAECHQDLDFQAFAVDLSNVELNSFDRLNNHTSPSSELESLLYSFYELPGNGSPFLQMFPPDGVTVRTCIFIDQSTLEDNEIDKCLQYPTNPVFTKEPLVVSRNAFCITQQGKCVGAQTNFDLFDGPVHGVFPLSVLFPFKTNDEGCKEKVSGLCLDEPKFSMFPVTTEYLLSSSEQLTEKFKGQLAMLLWYSLPKSIQLTKAFVGEYFADNVHEEQHIIWVKLAGNIVTYLRGDEMLKTIENFQNIIWYIRLVFGHSQKYMINTAVNINGTKMTVSKNHSIQSKKNLDISNDLNIENLANETNVQIFIRDMSYKTRICDQYYVECKLHNETVESGFTITDVICLDTIAYGQLHKHFENQIWIYTGMALSVISLIVSLIINRVLGLNESIQGSNMQNLTVALILSTILFAVGVNSRGNPRKCYYIGVSLHYLWLTIFSFISISLIYATHNLRKILANRAHKQTRESNIKYTSLGLLLPLIVVVPAVFLDSYVHEDLNLKYSGKMCFLTGFPAHIVFLSAPIGISVLINMCCLLFVALSVTKQSFKASLLRKSNSYHSLIVLGRIGIITGVFWISGVVTGCVNSLIVEYVFVVVCSFQGIFIAAAILFDKMVLLQLRKFK